MAQGRHSFLQRYLLYFFRSSAGRDYLADIAAHRHDLIYTDPPAEPGPVAESTGSSARLIDRRGSIPPADEASVYPCL